MPPSLMRRAGQAVALNAMANWFGMLGGMFSLIFIARLVSPDHFGIYGMAMIVIMIPTVIMIALGESLIQRKDLLPGHLNAIFTQNLLIAAVSWGLVTLLSPWLAKLFNEPDLEPVVRVFIIVLILESLTTVPAMLLQRELRYGALSLVDVLGVVIASIVGITAAWYLRSEWALVLMEIARRTFRMVAFCYLTRWRPSFDEAWSHAGDLMKFNSYNTSARLVQTVKDILPGAMIGGGIGAAELGMFNMANRLLDQTRAALVTPFSSIALPVVSKMQDDYDALRDAVEGGMRLISLFAYPAYLGGAAVAPVAIPFVFGAQWEPAVPVVQIVLLCGIRSPTAAFNSSILLGVGRPDRFLKIAIADLIMVTAVVFTLLPYGLIVLTWGLFGTYLGTWLVATWYVRQTIRFPIHRQLLAGWTSFVSAVIMATSVIFMSGRLPEEMASALQLMLLIGLGVVVYFVALMIIAPRLAGVLWRVARVIVSGRPKEAISIVRQGITSA